MLLICVTVFLSYLPEAGQYSSFFLYLKQVRRFSVIPALNLAAEPSLTAAAGWIRTFLFLFLNSAAGQQTG